MFDSSVSHARVAAPILVLAVSCVVSGCLSSRSISDTGGYDGYGYYWGNPMYRGEIPELNILSIDPEEIVTDERIAAELSAEHRIEIKSGCGILLVQSGAPFPDEPMERALSQHFQVTPFSGVLTEQAAKAGYGKALRLTAAQGGLELIACYWGVLETARTDLATKTLSWAPVVGRIVPDESQEVRLRLKMLLLDTRTGRWRMLTPEPVSDKVVSARLSRRSSDDRLVAALKERGYAALAEQVVGLAGADGSVTSQGE